MSLLIAKGSWNPWQGCEKQSAGCDNCFMFRQKESYGQDPLAVVRSKDPTFNLPEKLKEPQVIYVCTWSDFFIPQADQWRGDAWEIMRRHPEHTFLISTKWPERISECLPANWGQGWPNVWLGVSVEDQDTADIRIESLRHAKTAIRWLCVEPLLDTITLRDLRTLQINWVVIGGETGEPGSHYDPRPMPVEAAIHLVDQARASQVPVFVAQVGSALAKQMGMADSKGGDFDQFPDGLRYREFPQVLHG